MNRWRQTAVVALDVPQASGVACLGADRFLVVDDDRGIYLASSTGEATLLASRKKHPMLRDLEGICLGPGGDVWVVSERTSEVLALALERGRAGVRLGRPQTVGTLARRGRASNKGWEGIALWPGPPARLLATHEAQPRRVGVFSLAGLEADALLHLPTNLKHLLDDVSDITVDPLTGHLLLLSDESAALAEVRLCFEDDVPVALEGLAITSLALRKKEKAEGLSFDDEGHLWIVTDGDPHLHRFARG